MDTITASRPTPLIVDPLNFLIEDLSIDNEGLTEMDYHHVITPPDSSESHYSYSPSMASPEECIQAMSPAGLGLIDKPRLVILEQPVDKFRFRYKSEMAGTHGCLTGRNSDKSRKVTFPTVELKDYEGTAIIRCSIYTADENRRFPHAHRLMKDDLVDPHDLEVGPNLGYEAVFSNMGIIHTAKKHVAEELKKKKERLRKEKKLNKTLTILDENQISKEVEEEVRCINLNTVSLCFEAFRRYPDGLLEPLCEPIFSDPINNSKSAMTGELKICRMSTTVSSCSGGQEVFVLVEKVVKKNIRVRFFEVDDTGEVEVWADYGRFTDLDVHHQYAIVLKTPPYRDQNIKQRVEVFVQLERISDGDRSEAKSFTYKPDFKPDAGRAGGKRKRFEEEIPTTIESYNNTAPKILPGSECLKVLDDCVDGIDSSEFKKFMENLDETEFECLSSFSSTTSSTSSSLTTDGPRFLRREHLISKLSDIDEDVKEINMEVELPEVEYKIIEETETQSEMSLESNNVQLNIAENLTPEEFVNNIIRKISHIHNSQERDAASRIQELLKVTLNAGESVLHVALENNMIDAIKSLLKILKLYGTPDIVNYCNDNGETLLHRAVQCGLANVVESLISLGASPNIPDNNGDTALHSLLKIKQRNEKIVDIMDKLLKSRLYCEPDLENDEGLTPLHLSIKRGIFEAVKLLIDAGCDINHICRRDGDAALHMAVQENNAKILEYLLQCSNVNVNQQNFGGYTPLHKAVVEGNKELCLLLRQHNADPNIPNNQFKIEVKEEIPDEEEECTGMTSIQLALHNQDILNILKTEALSPSMLPEVYIKEEIIEEDSQDIKEEENIEDSKDLFTLDDHDIENLATVFDKNDLWIKLTEYLSCEDKIEVYKQAESPTKAVIYDQKTTVTKPMIREFLEYIQEENSHSDGIDHMIINELIKQLKI